MGNSWRICSIRGYVVCNMVTIDGDCGVAYCGFALVVMLDHSHRDNTNSVWLLAHGEAIKMMLFSVGLIVGILLGAYAANHKFRQKVNARLMRKETLKPLDACIACGGSGLQTLKTGLQVQCPVCKGTGLK